MYRENSDSSGDNISETESDISDIVQLDGNISIDVTPKTDKIVTALNLPSVASYNCRSLLPKIRSLKIDLIERNIQLGFLVEIWEQTHKNEHKFEIEKMLELNGLQYISTPRAPNKKGVSYGGAAIVVNLEKFSVEKLNIFTPKNLEVIWGLLKPKNPTAKIKKIVTCSFYSPPNKNRNSKMADHIVSTLQMLCTRYPGCGIILGGDKNSMDIRPILNCGLRLRQVVTKSTRQGQILDVIIMNLSGLYKTPIIVPPLQPDDPFSAKPSDHSVPVCFPHTDRFKPPQRDYKVIKYRPLPDSALREFGQWIVKEDWALVSDQMGPNEQVQRFEDILKEKLDTFCPSKELRLSSKDLPFMTSELKKLKRQKMREYVRKGKSKKYFELLKLFKIKFKCQAKKFLDKNMNALRDSKPGQAYSVLKKLGAQLGDCIDSNLFTLSAHESESLSSAESAERIAQHFAAISQEFPPLDVRKLPPRVQTKLRCADTAPVVTEYEAYKKIMGAKKPRSGVSNDLPKKIIQEFAPELSKPVSRIINSITATGKWPSQWKLEHVVPIGKMASPETEDDLRPISLTPFFSKVTEHFVVKWLLSYIKDKIDFRQYGGQKGNSITHYLIEFITFILSCQDSSDQTAILAVMVDFSKAFNRQNHNILITKLSDMGVPSWLLRVVIGFLSDRHMVVRYKGELSESKYLPGGGPQGTLLGLLLFIVLINDVGFKDQSNNLGDILTSKRNMKEANLIHLKYVDDLTLAEAIDLPTKLVSVPDRQRPDSFHARTGHILPDSKSLVSKQL